MLAGGVGGDVSLTGGEEFIIGTALVRLLYDAINTIEMSTSLEYTVAGAVILPGVTVDPIVKSLATRRRLSERGWIAASSGTMDAQT